MKKIRITVLTLLVSLVSVTPSRANCFWEAVQVGVAWVAAVAACATPEPAEPAACYIALAYLAASEGEYLSDCQDVPIKCQAP